MDATHCHPDERTDHDTDDAVAPVAVVTAVERALAVADWLMAAHLCREEVRRAWARPYGAAALDCGTLFSVVRMPESLVHAAVRTDEPAQVSVALARMLEGGPVIRDPRGRRCYALTPASVARRWDAPLTVALGRGRHVVVPRPDAVEPHPVASYWAVPMPSAGVLCEGALVAGLVAQGLARLAEMAPPDIATMRATVARVLGLDRPVLRHTDLDTAVSLMTGHFGVLLPEVDRLAELHAEGPVLAYACATLAHARDRLDTDTGPTLQSATARAQGLARLLADLCELYEVLADMGPQGH